jgi:hypothetical protein
VSTHPPARRQAPVPKRPSAATWAAALLAVTTVVAGLGWAGVIGGGDSQSTSTTLPASTSIAATTTTLATTPEWTATVATEADLYQCPAGATTGDVAAGEQVVVTGRAEGNHWVSVQRPQNPEATAWMRVAAIAPDAASPAWGDLPLGTCDLTGEGIQRFRGRVVDAATGTPLAGVGLAPTDVDGNPLPAYAVTSATDGSYEIGGLVDAQYGLWVDGAAAGYEQGFAAASVGPLGYLTRPTWPEAAAVAPGTLGDIALDSTGAPVTTTLPAGDTTTTVVGGPNQLPAIGALTATPSRIYSQPGNCSTIKTLISVEIVDSSGLESVKVRWSYGSHYGTRTMYQVPDSNTWQVTLTDFPKPAVDGVAVQLEVTATDNEGLVSTQLFPAALTLKFC